MHYRSCTPGLSNSCPTSGCLIYYTMWKTGSGTDTLTLQCGKSYDSVLITICWVLMKDISPTLRMLTITMENKPQIVSVVLSNHNDLELFFPIEKIKNFVCKKNLRKKFSLKSNNFETTGTNSKISKKIQHFLLILTYLSCSWIKFTVFLVAQLNDNHIVELSKGITSEAQILYLGSNVLQLRKFTVQSALYNNGTIKVRCRLLRSFEYGLNIDINL